MGGIKTVLSLSLASVTGLTLLVLGCALPAFSNWLPIFVVVFYILAPIPIAIARHMQYNSSGTSAGLELAIFFTTGIVISAFALPFVLAHVGTISYGAYILVFVANIVSFASVFGIYKYFRGDFDDSHALW
ncbi:vacuolar protein sorting 55 domain-containing protein [Ditylenchus destructor]|uniref:Vacuolar protein sorting 55 domain-containing protein n=1 Tax=Ditylenchus destructor TaxID=166010 RepID=A0AAD4R9X9_9BILA|nr:vacuolar protein sorting 55 domain-containing protein [Ditylenchus destructor]